MRLSARAVLLVWVALLPLGLVGCGAGGSGVWVLLQPRSVTVEAGQTQQFDGKVVGVTNPAVAWAADGGSITDDGLFTAPMVPGTYHVTATSVEQPGRSLSAVVTVTQAPNTAVRHFSTPTYTPGVPVSVSVAIRPTSGAGVYAAEEMFPPRWAITAVSDGGVVDAANGKIKWFFADNIARTLTFTATPPADETGSHVFAGIFVIDDDPPVAFIGQATITP